MADAMTHPNAETKFNNVTVLSGGLKGWQVAGKPLAVSVLKIGNIHGDNNSLKSNFVDIVNRSGDVVVIKPNSTNFYTYSWGSSSKSYNIGEGRVGENHITQTYEGWLSTGWTQSTPREYWRATGTDKGAVIRILDGAPFDVHPKDVAPSKRKQTLSGR